MSTHHHHDRGSRATISTTFMITTTLVLISVCMGACERSGAVKLERKPVVLVPVAVPGSGPATQTASAPAE